MDNVWFVTTYRRTADLKICGKLVRKRRTVGFFRDKLAAIACVEGNYGDLEEAGYYQYAVVEGLPFGLYPLGEDRTWFEFNMDTERWERSDTAADVIAAQYGMPAIRFSGWTEVG